jgi:hypothetical protein
MSMQTLPGVVPSDRPVALQGEMQLERSLVLVRGRSQGFFDITPKNLSPRC